MRPDLRRLAGRARLLMRSRSDAGIPGPAGLDLLGLYDSAYLARPEFEAACRRLAANVHVGDNIALCRILGRYKAYVDPRDASVAAHLLLDGFWESWLTRFIAGFVERGWTVADVGANYGYYTLLLADLVGPEGSVAAIEPNPEAAGLLRRSITLNGFVPRTRVHEVAAGAAEGGTATLVVTPTMSGGAAIAEVNPWEASEPLLHQVPVTTLDALFAAEERLDFLKIDVEGSEERVVAGMEGIFSRGRPHLVLEFNPSRYGDSRAFLNHLIGLYGSLREIDFAGDAAAVDPERVLGEPTEWLLFLSRS